MGIWYIYLHLVYLPTFDINVGKYTNPMDPMELDFLFVEFTGTRKKRVIDCQRFFY